MIKHIVEEIISSIFKFKPCTDKCLYLAKEKGRNRFIIYNESKHGSLENNSRHIHKILDLSDHSEYMSGVVSDIILELVSRGKDAIDDVANNITV